MNDQEMDRLLESDLPLVPISVSTGLKTKDVAGAVLPLQTKLLSYPSTLTIPKGLTQKIVDATPRLKRLQQDLLILTSFNENETLHWRPSWFKQEPFSESFWTLHNPPNVVTERVPSGTRGRDCFTRRMRCGSSQPPFIKTWDHWRHYCNLYGVPYDFLCEEQVELMRLGLPRDEAGSVCGMLTALRTEYRARS